jgi:hypothetical protein
MYSARRRGGREIKDVESSGATTTVSKPSRLPDIHLSTTIITPAHAETTGKIEGDAKNVELNSQEDPKQNPEDSEETLKKETENSSKGKLVNCS